MPWSLSKWNNLEEFLKASRVENTQTPVVPKITFAFGGKASFVLNSVKLQELLDLKLQYALTN